MPKITYATSRKLFNCSSVLELTKSHVLYQARDVKMIWVDRLGFDLHICSEEGIFAVRIPFSREVADEKAVKSSFNMMSHHAWEVERSYVAPEFEKVQLLKKVR
jgi:hypothetical protein